MAEGVYFGCSLASLLCAILLFKAHASNHMPLLFWSALCFVALTVNNCLLLVDLVLEPELNFTIGRNLTGLLGASFLLYGLLWSEEGAKRGPVS